MKDKYMNLTFAWVLYIRDQTVRTVFKNQSCLYLHVKQSKQNAKVAFWSLVHVRFPLYASLITID